MSICGKKQQLTIFLRKNAFCTGVQKQTKKLGKKNP